MAEPFKIEAPNKNADKVDREQIGIVVEARSHDAPRPPATRPDADIPIVDKHVVGKDGRTDLLRTEDGREFQRQKDGSYLVTVPGAKPEIKPVVVHDVSVVNGNVSYRIGNYMAVEGHGKRFVSNLLTGETVDHSRKKEQPKEAQEQTKLLQERLLNGGTEQDRLQALRGLITLSHTQPAAARFLDEAAKGTHDRDGRSLSQQVVAESVKAEQQRLQQATSGNDIRQEYAALSALIKLRDADHNGDAQKALQDYISPLGIRDEKRAAKVELALLMNHPDPFAGDQQKMTPAVLGAAAQFLEQAGSKGPLTYEQARFAAGALRFTQENIKDSTTLQDKFATILGAQLDGAGAVDAIRAIQNQLGKYPDEQNVLIKYSLLKSTNTEDLRNALASSIVRSGESSPVAKHLLDQILAKDKTSEDAALLRHTREELYLKQFQDLVKDGGAFSPDKILPALKNLASIEDSSPAAKKSLDHFAQTDSISAGSVSYARLNNEGGPAQVLKGAAELKDPRSSLALWQAAASDLSLASWNGNLSDEQIGLAVKAKVQLEKAARTLDETDNNKINFNLEYASKPNQKVLDDILKQAVADGKQDLVAAKCLEALKAETAQPTDFSLAFLATSSVERGARSLALPPAWVTAVVRAVSPDPCAPTKAREN